MVKAVSVCRYALGAVALVVCRLSHSQVSAEFFDCRPRRVGFSSGLSERAGGAGSLGGFGVAGTCRNYGGTLSRFVQAADLGRGWCGGGVGGFGFLGVVSLVALEVVGVCGGAGGRFRL